MENLDNQLVRDLQSDDRNAFDQLFRKYNHAIYLNVLKITKDVNASEDIVQDVFVTLWEKRLSIDAENSVANWIFVVSYNKSINYLKKKPKVRVIFSEIKAEFLHENEDKKDLKEKQLSLLELAVNMLSPQKRKAFELCKLQGKTYGKAADELQISKHTVKEYLSSAMRNIKEFIKATEAYK